MEMVLRHEELLIACHNNGQSAPTLPGMLPALTA
jgi:hypothetical protein